MVRGLRFYFVGTLYLFIIILIPQVAFTKPSSKKIPSSEAYSITTPTGKTITCYQSNKGDYKSGNLDKKGNFFKPESEDLKKLKIKLTQAKDLGNKKSQKKLSAQIKIKKSSIKDNAIFCKNGEGSKTPIGSISFDRLDRALTREDVRYLFEKVGFGLSPSEESFVSIGIDQGLDALVSSFMQTRAEDSSVLNKVDDYLDNQLDSSTTQSPAGQRAAQFYLLANTKNPYAEKFAFFLLSIWTVSGDVISAEAFRHELWDYYKRLRDYAYDQTDIKALAIEITKNPLMLIYLSNDLNIKGNPNENYARELMELFLLGPTDLEGILNYSETQLDGSGDIPTSARMLTGMGVTQNWSAEKLDYKFTDSKHDFTMLTMFPTKSYKFTGNSAEGLINGIVEKHPSVKNYYSKEILKEYLTPNPPKELVENFGKIIATNNYNLRPAMATLFKSKAFYDHAYRDTAIKNPIEFGVEFVRLLGLEKAINPNEIQKKIATVGMEFNASPSVFWYPNEAWGTPASFLGKANLISYIISDTTALALPDPDWVPQNILPVGVATPTTVASFAADHLGIGSISEEVLSSIEIYMNTVKQWNGIFTSKQYDNTDLTDRRRKGMGVYFLLSSMPQFHLK